MVRKNTNSSLDITYGSFINKDHAKRSSFETTFNVANTMMGTALLVMPVNFYKSGIISSIIAAIIMAAISYWTCNLCVIHSRDDEIDFPVAIKRILGKKWAHAFNVLSMILLLLVAIIHFILMANVFYTIFKNFVSDPDSYPKLNNITFNMFSMQYSAIIIAIICAILYSFKSISKILTINDKGIYMILTFTIFIIYLGCKALSTENISFITNGEAGIQEQELTIILFNYDLTEITGVFSLAYMIHNAIVGIMKPNKNQENNSKDLFYAYLIVLIKYILLGLLGSFAYAAFYYHETHVDGKYVPIKLPSSLMYFLSNKNNTFLNYPERILGIISLILVFIQLSTVIPILNFFTRRQLFSLIYHEKDEVELTPLQFHGFNILFNLLCLGFAIPAFEPIAVISLTGAFGGLILIYILPSYTHLKCLYFKKKEGISDSERITEKFDTEIENFENNECRENHHSTKSNKYFVYAFYLILLIFGLCIFGVTLHSSILYIINSLD